MTSKDYSILDFKSYYNDLVKKIPFSELKTIKSARELKYHQKIFDFLGVIPYISLKNIEIIEEKERELGIKFPESVKEWYFIIGSELLMSNYYHENRIIPINDFEINKINIIEMLFEDSCICEFKIGEGQDPRIIY